jgi:membrane protease YdiL (CAAX protease family)
MRVAREGTVLMANSAKMEPAHDSFIKPFWADLIGPPWVASLVVFAVLIAVRYFAYLGPFQMPALFFLQTVAMWMIPFAVLDRDGRFETGLAPHVPSFIAMLLGLIAGGLCGAAFLNLGYLLYGHSADNWCFSIRSYLHFEEMRGVMSPLALFALYSLPAIFLNPIGEEIMFRGLIQQSFARRFNGLTGMAVSSLLFGFTYLYLHGIWQDSSGFHLRLGSAAAAVLAIASVGAVFALARKMSGSIWPAVAAHAGFNLTILAVEMRLFAR